MSEGQKQQQKRHKKKEKNEGESVVKKKKESKEEYLLFHLGLNWKEEEEWEKIVVWSLKRVRKEVV